MNLLLQILETGRPTLLCVNLMDEAESKGIHIDLDKLEKLLGIPVVGTVARNRRCRAKLLDALDKMFEGPRDRPDSCVLYPPQVEQAVENLLPLAEETAGLSPRFICLRLLLGEIEERVGAELRSAAREQRELLADRGISRTGCRICWCPAW